MAHQDPRHIRSQFHCKVGSRTTAYWMKDYRLSYPSFFPRNCKYSVSAELVAGSSETERPLGLAARAIGLSSCSFLILWTVSTSEHCGSRWTYRNVVLISFNWSKFTFPSRYCLRGMHDIASQCLSSCILLLTACSFGIEWIRLYWPENDLCVERGLLRSPSDAHISPSQKQFLCYFLPVFRGTDTSRSDATGSCNTPSKPDAWCNKRVHIYQLAEFRETNLCTIQEASFW